MSEAITLKAINEFVTAWYQALDQHAPSKQAAAFVADDVEMIFPEKALHGIDDLLAWYAGGGFGNRDRIPGYN